MNHRVLYHALRLTLVVALLFASNVYAGTKRILLAGDSWMAGTWLSKAGDKALQANGLGEFETEGTDTALGGSRADQWASNHKGKLDALRAALAKYPTIDVVHLCIGGNDFLRFASENDIAKTTPERRRAQWAVIRKDIQTVVDDILAQRPDLKVVIADYDYLDPAQMAKVYKAGFTTAFFGVDARTFNAAVIELGREKMTLAKSTPRCYYVQNWGLLQHHIGIPGMLKPLAVRMPGGAPNYDPYPGGDPGLTSGPAMPDGVHPTPQGFQLIFENAVKQFYVKWFRK